MWEIFVLLIALFTATQCQIITSELSECNITTHSTTCLYLSGLQISDKLDKYDINIDTIDGYYILSGCESRRDDLYALNMIYSLQSNCDLSLKWDPVWQSFSIWYDYCDAYCTNLARCSEYNEMATNLCQNWFILYANNEDNTWDTTVNVTDCSYAFGVTDNQCMDTEVSTNGVDQTISQITVILIVIFIAICFVISWQCYKHCFKALHQKKSEGKENMSMSLVPMSIGCDEDRIWSDDDEISICNAGVYISDEFEEEMKDENDSSMSSKHDGIQMFHYTETDANKDGIR